MFFQADIAQYHQVFTDLLTVYQGYIFFDHPFIFQPPDTLIHRGGGKVQSSGQLFGGQLGILLEIADDVAVGVV
ncbi:hypothetical protein D9M70_635910 [compost metagenome]